VCKNSPRLFPARDLSALIQPRERERVLGHMRPQMIYDLGRGARRQLTRRVGSDRFSRSIARHAIERGHHMLANDRRLYRDLLTHLSVDNQGRLSTDYAAHQAGHRFYVQHAVDFADAYTRPLVVVAIFGSAGILFLLTVVFTLMTRPQRAAARTSREDRHDA